MIVKVSVSEGRRPEEESSFWKISAERSRLEGEQADFQSITPSQIKSLEKGEKPLPSYLRQVSTEIHAASLTGAGGVLNSGNSCEKCLFIWFTVAEIETRLKLCSLHPPPSVLQQGQLY